MYTYCRRIWLVCVVCKFVLQRCWFKVNRIVISAESVQRRINKKEKHQWDDKPTFTNIDPYIPGHNQHTLDLRAFSNAKKKLIRFFFLIILTTCAVWKSKPPVLPVDLAYILVISRKFRRQIYYIMHKVASMKEVGVHNESDDFNWFPMPGNWFSVAVFCAE